MRDEAMHLRGVSFAHTNEAENSGMKFPQKWNRAFEREHVRRLKVSGHFFDGTFANVAVS